MTLAAVAALFVRPDGPYPGLVADWWDEERDATHYAGPHPVVAHPPCKRWGRFWRADGSSVPGNDGGLFASALNSVRTWGGVLEHPEGTHAWRAFDLPGAPRGAWARGICGGWSTCVAQRNYGHRVRKLTWLYYLGDQAPPSLDWSPPEPQTVYLTQPRAAQAGLRPRVKLTGTRENELTPLPFARLLVGIASC